ncbi:helix-turn-helix domain-containing protein [Siminovitchia sp. 179-K 8D1 HS]|uniref:helix-turn-helix domain-containing protein n=1 Tax=Siminovitchia sp. 179-K 8D1 HS TaxID=3142385 RepID=UPI00399FDBA3
MVEGFGFRLENLREKFGYSKKEISMKLGFTPNVYGAYEREERRPNLETLVRIADLFDVSIDYLVRGKECCKTRINEDITDSEKNIKELIHYLKSKGIDEPYILQIDKWIQLSREDLIELHNHFEWVVNKAKSQNED